MSLPTPYQHPFQRGSNTPFQRGADTLPTPVLPTPLYPQRVGSPFGRGILPSRLHVGEQSKIHQPTEWQ